MTGRIRRLPRRSSLAFGAGEVVSRLSMWGLPLALALFLTESEYAQFVVYLSVTSLLTLLILFGQEKHTLWNVAARKVSLDDVAVLGMLAALSALLLGVIAATGCDALICFESSPSVMFGLVCICFLHGLSRLMIALLRKAGLARYYVVYRLSINLVRVGGLVGIAFLQWPPLDLLQRIILAETVMGAVAVVPLLKARWMSPKRPRWAAVLGRLRFGAPVLAAAGCGLLMGQFDRLFLASVASPEMLAGYNLSYVVGSGLMFAFSAVAVVQEPSIYAAPSFAEAVRRASASRRQMLLMLLPAAAGVMALIALMDQYGKIPVDYPTTTVIVVAFCLMPYWYTASWLLVYGGRNRTVFFISAVALAVNMLMCFVFLLVPSLLVPAFATATAHLTMVLLAARSLRRAQ